MLITGIRSIKERDGEKIPEAMKEPNKKTLKKMAAFVLLAFYLHFFSKQGVNYPLRDPPNNGTAHLPALPAARTGKPMGRSSYVNHGFYLFRSGSCRN